ncbi:MAG: hypothetical protein JXQ99_10490 [Hyphomicrobiaceae bacterium]
MPTSVLLARATGKSVICLESGGAHQEAETHPLNEVVHLASPYVGAATGRFRCLGGTSTRWGGALIPFQAADLASDDWPLSLADLEPYLLDVESLFDLEPGPYCDTSFPFDLGKVHVNRLAKWPAFRKRNVVDLVGEDSRRLENLNIWLGATVVEVRVGPNGEGVMLQARSLAGDRLRVSASRLIIAAGAIETTRLALLINQQNRDAITTPSPRLGQYFSDHISMGIAEIKPRRLKALNKIIGFRFSDGGSMRNIRFELSGDAAARKQLPPCFMDVRFDLQRAGGFDALREIYRTIQKQQLPSFRSVCNLIGHLPWLMRAVWWRFVHRRLLFPEGSRLVAHTVIAQVPVAGNYIALSQTKRDPLGVPLAEINWRISDADVDNLSSAARLFEETWTGSELANYGTWQQLPPGTSADTVQKPDAFLHPTGSTRMAWDAADGVVDRDLCLFSLPQIQLLSTSVLPTAGGTNPTMMVMLLALRCVDQHAKA